VGGTCETLAAGVAEAGAGPDAGALSEVLVSWPLSPQPGRAASSSPASARAGIVSFIVSFSPDGFWGKTLL